MAQQKKDTASFVLRFTQKVFQDEQGEHDVQWRGKIEHVQGGEELRFANVEEALTFIQGKLRDLTIQATEDKTPEEQQGILSKSFELWRRMAKDAPKMVRETIKDPMKQVAQIQSQIQEVGDTIGQRINERIDKASNDLDEWRAGRWSH